jgi:hypothetical protein
MGQNDKVSGLDPEIVPEILALIADEVRNTGGTEEDLARVLVDSRLRRLLAAAIVGSAVSGDPFRARLAAAIEACRFAWVNPCITVKKFPEPVFGALGAGHLVAAPPRVPAREWWLRENIEAWLAEKVKEGYEPGTFADGLEYTARNPAYRQFEPLICWGSVSADDEVVCIGPFGGGGLGGRRDSRPGVIGLDVSKRDATWPYICVFLLRLIKKS